MPCLTGVAAAKRHPLVGRCEIVDCGDVLVEGGQVGQGLPRGQKAQRGCAAVKVGNRAGGHVVAAVVAVFQRHHERTGGRQQLHGIVAVHRGDNDAAVNRRTFTANTQEHGRCRAGLPISIVDIVSLQPGIGVGTVEMVLAEARCGEKGKSGEGCKRASCPAPSLHWSELVHRTKTKNDVGSAFVWKKGTKFRVADKTAETEGDLPVAAEAQAESPAVRSKRILQRRKMDVLWRIGPLHDSTRAEQTK